MSTIANFDYLINNFVTASNLHHKPGRVFDKVYEEDGDGTPLPRYMVERSTGNIYGVKSWNQFNPRRIYGSLDTIDQWSWTVFPAVPKMGTDAETFHRVREASFAKNYKKRGRPVGAKNKNKMLSSSAGNSDNSDN